MATQWPPKKNTAFTLYFTLYKNDGTVIANPGTYTKKVSIDGAAIADIAASVIEEDTTYGQLSVVLSSSEMNGDAIWVQIKDDTSGCVPYTTTIYTAGSTHDELKADTAAILADTGTDGVVVASGAKTGYSLANGSIAAATFAAGAIDAAAIANNAIDAATFAADVDAEVAAYIWNAATESYGTAGTYGALIESGNVGGGAIVAASVTGAVGSVTGSVGSVTGAVGSVTGNVGGNVTGSVGSVASGGITAASIATGAIDADALAADTITAAKIATGAITSAKFAAGAIDAAAIANGAIDAATIADDAWTRLGVIGYGTMQAGSTSTTAVLASATNIANDLINGAVLFITGGTGAYQARAITDWVQSTDTATVDTWTTTPDNTSTYVVFAAAPASATSVPAVNVTQWGGSAIATPTQAGVPEVDLTHVAGTAVTASAGRPEVNVTHAAGTAWGSGAITAASVAADAVTEIQSGLATASSLSTVAGYLDTEVAAILAAVDTEVAAIKAKTDNLPAAPAATGDIPTVTDIWQRVIEGSITAEQLLRALLAFAAGQATGGGTTSPAFRDQADTKNRIAMTVDTATGDRSAVTLDLT